MVDTYRGGWPRRGPLEDYNRDPEPPFCFGDTVPWCSPWVLGKLWYGIRHPRDQSATTYHGHEVGGPLRDISGYPEGLQYPGPGQVS